MAAWIAYERSLPVSVIASKLPSVPGKYAFFVDDLASLPELFRSDALSRPVHRLLYLGKADVSLARRVYEEECQHRRPGTFFRSVGAMLGYRSPTGGRNYEFAPADKAAVIAWISKHLRAAWSSDPAVGSHRTTEQALIRQFMPLLNLQGNPRKLAELQRLRGLCRMGLPARV